MGRQGRFTLPHHPANYWQRRPWHRKQHHKHHQQRRKHPAPKHQHRQSRRTIFRLTHRDARRHRQTSTINKETLSFEIPELNNTYSFGTGDGEVRISDTEGEDILQLNADILNTLFVRNGDDLDIQLNQSNDKLVVENWFANENNQIESIISNDGYALANNQVQLLIENMSSFTNDNNVSWAEAVNQDATSVKGILEQVWIKSE